MSKVSFVKNGRQAGKTLGSIRADHRERYQLAIETAAENGLKRVVDVGTGTGYGAYMMATAGLNVTAYEIDAGAIEYGEQHFAHPNLERIQADVARLELPRCDMVTAFEIIEHTTGAIRFLQGASKQAQWLVASVPNEHVVPFDQTKHRQHVRHYTDEQLWAMLDAAGWDVEWMGCQVGKHGDEAKPRFDITLGRTLITVAKAR